MSIVFKPLGLWTFATTVENQYEYPVYNLSNNIKSIKYLKQANHTNKTLWGEQNLMIMASVTRVVAFKNLTYLKK